MASRYPLARPASGDDPRFALGLVIEVSDVLARFGFPPLENGDDLARFQQALFTAIYGAGQVDS